MLGYIPNFADSSDSSNSSFLEYCKNYSPPSSYTMHTDPSDMEQAFLSAYDEYADAIFRHCVFRMGNRERAKELMQDTFMKTWTYISRGKTVDNLKAFLYRTANNLIVDELRRRAKRTEVSFEDMQETGFDIEATDDAKSTTEQSFTASQVYDLLNQIDETYRTAVIMRFIDELQPTEIGTALGISANAASVRINRGIEKLRSLLDTYE